MVDHANVIVLFRSGGLAHNKGLYKVNDQELITVIGSSRPISAIRGTYLYDRFWPHSSHSETSID